MSVFERLCIKLARFSEALGDMDDPIGDYIFSLGKRIDKLERDVEHLESLLHSRPGADGIQQ